MRKTQSRPDRKRVYLFTAIGVILAAAVLFAVYRLAPSWENDNADVAETVDANTTRLARVTYNGKQYIENTSVTTLLLLGIDKDRQTETQFVGDYRNGGQADFIMLMVIDNDNHTVRRLQIDRDSVTQVPYLSIMGKDMGTREWYIALAHAFGKTPEDNNRNTAQAVTNLFVCAYEQLYPQAGENAAGIKKLMANLPDIDMCASLNMNGIGPFTDALGGVTVTIEDDFSGTTKNYQIGEKVTLRGAEAESYVRIRHALGEGTNEERMKNRQRAYMTAAQSQLLKKAGEDSNFLNTLFEDLIHGGYLVTDFNAGRLIVEISDALNYEIYPIEYIDGTHSVETNGYVRFDPDPVWLTEWVLRTYYNEKK